MTVDRTISLNAVKKMIKGLPDWAITKNAYTYQISVEDLMKGLDDLPPVTPQPKTGHWINVNKGKWNTIPVYKCSECEANADLRDWSGESPFCPWCGAKMVKPQEVR